MANYFAFKDFEFKRAEKKILFRYETGFDEREALTFTEIVELPSDRQMDELPQEVLDALLRDVHLMLGISYFKLFCPSEIRLPYELSSEEAAFWSTVYRKGLGEFSYRNDLDLRGIRFPATRGRRMSRPKLLPTPERALIGIGGGKDSVVALELLKGDHYACDGFVVETYTTHDIAQKICDVAGVNLVRIRRTLDEKVFDRSLGAYEGHIPISAIYAFLGTLAAALYGYRYVVVGNEWSSNFGNVEHHGEVVNHQWSKSVEFEALFQQHMRSLTPSVSYFSIVRPLYEIRIAELFSRYPRYFPYFTGCNRKFRIDASRRPKHLWCAECPKCAFIFLILAPYVPKKDLAAIFGKNMLEDRALEGLFADVLGFGGMKPFDCVGTFEEAQAALYLVRQEYGATPIGKKFLPKIGSGNALVRRVTATAAAPSVPTRFRFLGMRSALILGYGREGRVSESFLKDRYPHLEMGRADEELGADYLQAQDFYDIAVRTPGIPKQNLHTHYATATNIFFSRFPGKTIGVTGSKGKSTTASLIHRILLEAGLPARLAGNIGTPMLELLMEGVDEDCIAVLELSSYQLDDIEYSPDVAVVTNLFPEHMDYHGGVEAYYEAKRNIVRFQKDGDTFVYNAEVPELAAWAKDAGGNAMPFVDALPFAETSVALLGEHNRSNVRAAVAVASLFNIPPEIVERAVRSFSGLPHRLEFVGEFKGIRFYDDAISTAPESTIPALDAVPKIGTIFLGGLDRGYDFVDLERAVRAAGIKNIVLFPESGRRMFADRSDLNVLDTSSMHEAVAFAYTNTKKGAAVLLSCASPSYGLWKNFEEKGDEFKKEVTSQGSHS